MKRLLMAAIALAAVCAAPGFAHCQSTKEDDRVQVQVHIDILVAQVHRDALRQCGLTSPTGDARMVVDRERAEQAIRSLADLGLARLVTKPQVMTLDGQQAVIEVATEPPAPLAAVNGSLETSQMSVGVALQVTPKVQANGRIVLAVESQLSARSESSVRLDNGVLAPIFDVSQTSFHGEVGDGQTLAFTQASGKACDNESKTLPLLAYLPILGRLAGNDAATRENSAWVVLMTPRVDRPQVEERPMPKQLQFELCICEGDPNGSREAGTMKILSNPTLVTLEDRSADFNVGGEAPVVGGKEIRYLPFGVRFHVLPSDSDGNSVFIDGGLEVSSIAAESTTALVQLNGRIAKFAGRIKLGGPIRVMMDKADGKNVWCDLTVTDVTAK